MSDDERPSTQEPGPRPAVRRIKNWLTSPRASDRRPSPGGMSLNLNSNNPFRRAAASPSTPPLATPAASGLSPPSGIARPMSTTNPFLDNYQPLAAEPRPTNAQIGSPPKAFAYDGRNKREATVNTSNASELMVCVPEVGRAIRHGCSKQQRQRAFEHPTPREWRRLV